MALSVNCLEEIDDDGARAEQVKDRRRSIYGQDWVMKRGVEVHEDTCRDKVQVVCY